MREAIFTTEIMRSLRRAGAWAYKIPDAPTSRITGMSFTLTKPCDIVACAKGYFLGIETKQIKKWKKFGKKDMRPSQIVNLDNIVKAGGEAYVFLNVRIPKQPSILIILKWVRFRDDILKGIPIDHLKSKRMNTDLKDNKKKIYYELDQIFPFNQYTYPDEENDFG